MSLSKNGLQPQLIRYDAKVDADPPNQSLMLLHRFSPSKGDPVSIKNFQLIFPV